MKTKTKVNMADSSERNGLISQFVSVSGISEDRAAFYLESAQWNVQLALERLYDTDGSPEVQSDAQPAPPVSQPTPTPSSVPKPTTQSRFATIGSLKGQDDGSSSEEEGQAFYAGGSERGGGQQILGPSKKKTSDNVVKDVFKAAREHGAEEVEAGSSAATSGHSVPFHGRAYRLGDSTSTSEEVSSAARLPDYPTVEMALKLWKNGFSVDNGPLREFSSPENVQFLNDVKKGEVPRELIRQAKGGEVNLKLEDHRQEEYVKPRVAVQAFAGAGRRLGCPSDPDPVLSASANASSAAAFVGGPSSSSSTSPATTAVAASVAGSASENHPPDFNASQPSTSIQIRLADGTRLMTKFNLIHHISDIRQLVIAARPSYATSNFVLLTTFPNVELTDESKTIADAKLSNAVVVQRMR